MSEELRWLVSSGIALALVILGMFLYNLIRAPVFLKFERMMEPCLEVLEFRRQNEGAYGNGFCWGFSRPHRKI